ncbi:hypothetical protein XM38_033740 [Halomicronema hongdechloris C2206]|uniref:vWA-MoxR associated protein N-terminal HTH domain-containing protein n=1 Tax=Halomicronema hongdechloris C2206 TaxID=1641165 RepID=A0A1Z3HQL2_9CYAN|nr:hypothetical protein [Halomicronema hongdechloris]ASC72417.1 hypothetical protein XM38_033740 [Halomicronema hongdechloris C2206]
MDTFNNAPELTAETALDYVDWCYFDHTGHHLTDLERQVFLGSWQGQTYEEIYPSNPEYLEKNVAYKLWRKLSQVLGERVHKKHLRGAVMRSHQRQGSWQIAIYHRQSPSDRRLAEELERLLQVFGHRVTRYSVDGIASDKRRHHLGDCGVHLTTVSPRLPSP